MRFAIPIICLVSCVTIGCRDAQRPEAQPVDAAGGQKITKEFYPDGTIKTITRLDPDGRLVGTLYHTTNGAATHLDYFDDSKRVRRTLLVSGKGAAFYRMGAEGDKPARYESNHSFSSEAPKNIF